MAGRRQTDHPAHAWYGCRGANRSGRLAGRCVIVLIITFNLLLYRASASVELPRRYLRWLNRVIHQRVYFGRTGARRAPSRVRRYSLPSIRCAGKFPYDHWYHQQPPPAGRRAVWYNLPTLTGIRYFRIRPFSDNLARSYEQS